jgi:hypothetical protein
MSNSPEEFREDQQGIAQVLQQQPQLRPFGRAPLTVCMSGPYDRKPFEDLGDRLYGRFSADAPAFLCIPPVEHGFAVIARGVAKCVFGYRDYVHEAEIAGSIEELIAGLFSPKTIRFFTAIARTDSQKNTPYERNLDLKRRPTNVGTFVYDAVEGCFAPDPEYYGRADRESRRIEGLDDEEARYSICPANRYIPMLWRSMVEASHEEGLLELYKVTETPAVIRLN